MLPFIILYHTGVVKHDTRFNHFISSFYTRFNLSLDLDFFPRLDSEKSQRPEGGFSESREINSYYNSHAKFLLQVTSKLLNISGNN